MEQLFLCHHTVLTVNEIAHMKAMCGRTVTRRASSQIFFIKLIYLFLNYCSHTIFYAFRMYKTVIPHSYTLQNEHCNNPSSHLPPYKVITIY